MRPKRRYIRLIAVALSLLLLGTLAACTTGSGTPAPTDTSAIGDHMTDPSANSSTAVPEDERATAPDGETAVPLDPPAEASENDPVFVPPGGFLHTPAELTLNLPAGAPADAYILYTTDGSEPDAKTGKRYRAAIPLLKGTDVTVIRAALFAADGSQLGHTVTATYCKADVSTLRVISLVTDPANLYGKNGILEDRSESGRAGERPVSVEIFDPDGTLLLRQDAAMRLAGAGSRSFDPANLRIIARKPAELASDGALRYSGRGKFHAFLFDGRETKAYDSFLLRCGGNDSFHQARGDFLRMNMLRDAITNNLCADAEALLGGTVFAQRTEPVAVYLNGAFYGLLNLKEDFDENYIEAVFGLPEAHIALLKGKKEGKSMYYHIEAGEDADLDDWQALLTYCAAHATAPDYAEAYRAVAAQIDIENFSRYYAVMLYLCNTDWPQNNTMVWRYTPADGDGTAGSLYADGKWRAVIRDMDLCFALHDKASQTSSTTYSMADTDTFYRITVFYRDGGYAYDPSLGLYDDTMGFQGLFDFLIRSEKFRAMFRRDCEVLMSADFAALARAEIERYYALATPAVSAHIDLWQGKGEIIPAYTLRHFKAAKDDMLEFVEDRPAYFRRYMEAALAYYE